MTYPAFWFVRSEPFVLDRFGRALLRDERLGVINTEALSAAQRRLSKATGSSLGPWAEDALYPAVGLPERFAPDFWQFGIYEFGSRRLREAMAQSADVVEFLPLHLMLAGPAARAQDYRWMRVVARQEALDIERCDCRVETRENAVTGKSYRRLSNIDFLAVRHGLVPRSEIFRVDESPTDILATDALAERVLRAGCTGIEFSHSENRHSGKRIDRIRTAEGIAERRIGFLD